MTETALVIAPHPDDEVIGCGGAILLYRRLGIKVDVVFLTSGGQGLPGVTETTACALREAEAVEAAQVLGVNQFGFLRLPDQRVHENSRRGAKLLGQILRERRPDTIYVPHPEESHPDHQAAFDLVRAVLAECGVRDFAPVVRGYEVWTPLARPDRFENIGAVMPEKLRALRCYRSQLHIVRYDRAMRGLNRYRGIMAAGCHYAEAFRDLQDSFRDHGAEAFDAVRADGGPLSADLELAQTNTVAMSR